MTNKQIKFIKEAYNSDDVCTEWKDKIKNCFNDIKFENDVPPEFEGFQIGDICVWEGLTPAIFRIISFNEDCCKSTVMTHDSLSYKYVRKATELEKKILGERGIFILSDKL